MGRFEKIARRGLTEGAAIGGRLPFVRARPLLAAFLRAMEAADQGIPELLERLEAVGAQVRRKQLESDLPIFHDVAVGVAREVLETEPLLRSHFAATAHLGVLEPLVDFPTTRETYVRLWLAMAKQLKQHHDGLGLGSRGNSAGASWKGEALTGLEAVQLWLITTNYGHTWGTFATERGLLIQLLRDGVAREELLSGIREELREPCRRLIEDADLRRFHYVLAAWRLSQDELDPDVRDTLVAAFGAFLLRPTDERTRRLLWVFSRSRQVTTAWLHSHLGIVPGVMLSRKQRDEFIRQLVDESTVLSEPDGTPPSLMSEYLVQLQSLQTDLFFTGEDASKAVLQHLRSFKRWWHSAAASPMERVAALFRKPPGWPEEEVYRISHYARFELPVEEDKWSEVVEDWRGANVWTRSNFFVGQRRSGVSCDLYCGDDFGPAVVAAAAIRVAPHVELSWNDEDADQESAHRLWYSVARFTTRLFAECLQEGRTTRLQAVPAAHPSVGLALLGTSVRKVSDRLAQFIERVTEPLRKRELRSVLQCLVDHSPVPGSVAHIVVLGRMWVLDSASGKQKAEIDGLWCDVSPAEVAWSALEAKSSKRSGPPSANLERLVACLRVYAGPIMPVRTNEGSVSIVSFSWV